MSWEGHNESHSALEPHQDRFRNRGEDIIHRLYSSAMEHLKRQGPGEAGGLRLRFMTKIWRLW